MEGGVSGRLSGVAETKRWQRNTDGIITASPNLNVRTIPHADGT